MLTPSEHPAKSPPPFVPGPAMPNLSVLDIARIREGFRVVSEDGERLAALFYGRLFEIDPSLRTMFTGDLTAQGRKLTGALALVVHSLDRLDGILGTIQALGSRHAAYGVKEHHYTIVGEALIDTLRACLGATFDAEAVRAWTTAYGALASAMLGAGEKSPAGAYYG